LIGKHLHWYLSACFKQKGRIAALFSFRWPT